jgi:hypothetical protein
MLLFFISGSRGLLQFGDSDGGVRAHAETRFAENALTGLVRIALAVRYLEYHLGTGIDALLAAIALFIVDCYQIH